MIHFILLTLPLITHLIVDFNGVVRHWLNAVYVFVISVAVGFLLPGYFWQATLFALAIHFSLFDPIYNKMHGHKLFYHGDPKNPDRAWTDKQWDKIPAYAEVFVRLWVLVVGYAVYFELDRIITYIP